MQFDVAGYHGLARLAAFGMIGYAILRYDPFADRPTRSRRSGRFAVAPVALALLFIVAQVAQNFFSAQYGLLTGGIVAGTFLFAANPIQKKIEGMGTHKPPRIVAGAISSPGAEDSFRSAVRMALKDGNVTPSEERQLLVLADHLGIRPARAFELRDEVEASRARRKR